jgi:purine catabolism regulator
MMPDLIEEISRALEQKPLKHAPRLTLTSADTVRATVLKLSTHRRCFLVVEGPAELNVDAFALLHVQSLIASEIEHLTRKREREDAAGAELFMKIINREVDSDAARAGLEQIGLNGPAWFVIAFRREEMATARAVLGDLGLRAISVELAGGGFLMIGAPDRQRVEELLLSRLGTIGISAVNSSVRRITDTVAEARWALQAARSSGGGASEYSKAAPMFLPRTVGDAQDAAHAVFGALVEYDRAHDSHLLETLEAFLIGDRQWEVVAQRLHIHRQTLGYRLRRIESLTGRTTRRSADIAMLWMALNAYRIGGTASDAVRQVRTAIQ